MGVCVSIWKYRSAHTYVFVNVVEANEHAPVFNGDRSDNWLNESVPIGTIITDLEVGLFYFGLYGFMA